MAGRIRDDDIALVRDKSPIADVIGEHVQLRNAGGGNLKGICPFHDEKSPSLSVSPARGVFHCLAGETRVLTEDGPQEISTLAGKTVSVLTEGGQWVDAPFHDFGVQQLWQLTLRRNGRLKTIFATAEHRWFLRDDRKGRKKGAERLTRDLVPGQRLASSFPTSQPQMSRVVPSPFGIARGITFGDGHRAHDGSFADLREGFEANPQAYSRRHWVVVSVNPTDRVESVYCAVVDRTHSFVLEDNILTGNCFGCGAGGDVIRFVERIEHLNFTDAVERLAARAHVQLRYVEGGNAPSRPQGQHARLVAAHAAAAAFYAEQLRTPEARPARDFLSERGFDEAVAATYGCGFAPAGWDALTRHLLAAGFSAGELTAGGLAKPSQRGSLIDRFHRRLLWPIRNMSGDVVGFGARRLFDDDMVEAKYLNTPETPIYKKSQLLYGADLAKKEIGRQHRAVVVEGYTDVMACHLAGVTTAIATCGTAFGSEHIGIIRRLLMDSDAFTGEVIFTFDGDAAGMKAAERAFADEQRFMAQTFVAIEEAGLDPCELRQKAGDLAVRDLVARRIPLVEFVLRTVVARFDLDTAEGRSNALDRGIPLVAQIKDHSLRDEYARRLAGLAGIDDPNRVVNRVRGLLRRGAPGSQPGDGASRGRPAESVDESVTRVEREVLKVALQMPGVAGPQFDVLDESAFLVPVHQQVRAAIELAGGTAAASGGPEWVGAVEAALADEAARPLIHELAVEPLRSELVSQERYADALIARLQWTVGAREIVKLKARVQRLNPVEHPEEYNRAFGELITLEAHVRVLGERAIGGV